MKSNEDDDFQSAVRQKAKSQSKRRNKLSSKYHSKPQKAGDGINKIDCDLFSPVSCTSSRKKSRMDGELGAIIISDDENIDNLTEICGNSEITKGSESNRSEADNFIKTDILNDFLEQTLLPNHTRQLNENWSNSEYKKKVDMNSLLVLQNDETDYLKGINDTLKNEVDNPESFPSSNCNTSCSNSFDKDFISKVFEINSSKNRKSIQECNDEDLGKLYSDNSEFSTDLNCFMLSSGSIGYAGFSESTETSIVSSIKADLEYKNTKVEDSGTSKSSNHSLQKDVFSNLYDTFKESKDQRDIFNHKEIGNAALCFESKIKSLSLEHVNNCTPDSEQGNTSDIKCEVISEKKYTSEVLAICDNATKKYSCPLCWKIFETSQLQIAHMKECAIRYKLSTRQLLDALELQEKQSVERSALGLPDIPTAHMMKKSTTKKKRGPGNDNNLQLALALSVSLQEAEDKEQLQEDERLMEAGLGHEVVKRQKTMLERFGFTNSRPALIPSTSSRLKLGIKKQNKNTILTQRTKEERERLITEKVAIILIGEENKSSVSVENVQIAGDILGAVNSLQKYEAKFNSLWSAVTSSCNEEQNRYVRELCNLISPCKFKAGEKIKHLSQVPGRNVTPARTKLSANDKRFHASSSSQGRKQLQNESKCLSVESKTRKSLQRFFTEKDKRNKTLAQTLSTDWRAILNKKEMSDVKIYVESEQEIPGHKLVFYVRCRSILNDIIENGSEKSISLLMWIDISYQAALAFLQFVYCGVTNKILRLGEKDMLAVEELAQRYRVTELKEHLKVISRVRTKLSKQSSSNSPQFHGRSVTPCKYFSPPNHEHTPQESNQNDSLTTDFSQHYLEYDMPLSEESIPFRKYKLSSYSPSKHYFVQEKCSLTSSPDNCMFPNIEKKKSSHILDNVIIPEQSMDIPHNHSQQINEAGMIKNEINMNSPSSKENVVKISSPDLFMGEENVGNVNELSHESEMNVHYHLELSDICQQNSNSSSPKINQNKSPIQRNISSSSSPVNVIINNSHDSTVSSSRTSLEHSAKTNDSTNETDKDISSLSLDNHNKSHSSAQESRIKFMDIKSLQPINDSKATKNNFDSINFLENPISDSPSKVMESEDRRTSVNSKRRCSKRDSSSDSYRSNTKKVCRKSPRDELINMSSQKVDTIELHLSETDECNIYKANISYVSKSSSELVEKHLNTLQDDVCNKTCLNRVIGSESKLEFLTGSEIKNLETGAFITANEEKRGTGNKQYQDDWDSFDEMCSASDPEIFSQNLNKLLSTQSISSNSEKHTSKNSLSSRSQKQISDSDLVITPPPHRRNNRSNQKSTNKKVSLEDTLMTCLNESILWRDENAPALNSSAKDRNSALLQEHNKYYKTPTQERNLTTENVTPPANYSAMKTPDLKRELDRYGLKPSLTKKQAKIMLRHIYDQLHPFVTESDSEDSTEVGENDLLSSPFKIPDKNTPVPKSPTKKVNNSGTSTGSKTNGQNQVSVRRSLASQIDCDELSSQESSSSSTVDVTEEILFEDLEEFGREISGSQDVYSSDILSSVVQHYIAGNPELHQKVLQHEPIWMEEFLDELRVQNYKFKMNQLMDYFDEQCITFRTLQMHRGRQRKQTREKKSPAKKKGKSSNNKSAASSAPGSPSSSFSN